MLRFPLDEGGDELAGFDVIQTEIGHRLLVSHYNNGSLTYNPVRECVTAGSVQCRLH